MDRRNILLAQFQGVIPGQGGALPPQAKVNGPPSKLPPSAVPLPPQVQKDADGTSVVAVYVGTADLIPSLRDFVQMPLTDLRSFLSSLVPSGPDQDELSILGNRAQAMVIGSTDQIRLTTLNASKDGSSPGLIQIVRLQ